MHVRWMAWMSCFVGALSVRVSKKENDDVCAK